MMRSSLRRDFSCPREIEVVSVALKKNLPELAGDDRLAIGAAQEGDHFDMKAFFRDVGQDRKNALRVCREIAAKRCLPGFAGLEDASAVSAPACQR
jgi:hypothetical protein